MSARRVVLLAVVTAALLVGLAALLSRDVRRPNLELVPADMVHSRAGETGYLTPAFPDRLVARTPPAGTIPRGADLAWMEYGTTPEEAARAGRELANPLPDAPRTRDRGATVFRDVCSACHGASGGGDGMVAKRGFPPPPTFHRPESRALADGEMFHAVTYGRKNMPPLGSIVAPADRWAAIRYVRALQEGR